ncbi:hypothetical protein EON65_05115, partial [archaeon]
MVLNVIKDASQFWLLLLSYDLSHKTYVVELATFYNGLYIFPSKLTIPPSNPVEDTPSNDHVDLLWRDNQVLVLLPNQLCHINLHMTSLLQSPISTITLSEAAKLLCCESEGPQGVGARLTLFSPPLPLPYSLKLADQVVAPFVGHNAFLRWSALQECAQIDKEDGIARVWSE